MRKKIITITTLIIILVQVIPIYNHNLKIFFIDQTTPNMIQRISGIFERNALISKGI